MPVDMRVIEDMLRDYAKRLASDLHEAMDALDDLSDATTREGHQVRLVMTEGLLASCEQRTRVVAMCEQLEAQRAMADRELFAGAWPPIEPITTARLRNSLLEDRDELPEDYLRLEDWEDQGDPLFVAFDVINTEMRTWLPKTPELATAIAIAVEWDEREGMGWEWPDRVVRRARKLALAELPRPH